MAVRGRVTCRGGTKRNSSVAALGCALFALVLGACTDPVERQAFVIAVLVDSDSVVRDEARRVEVEVDVEQTENSGWKSLEPRSYRTDPNPIRWPIEFKLAPQKTLGDSYGLLAVAYDSAGSVVARAQAIRPGKHAVADGLSVHFESQCFRQPTLCTEGMTCHRGACISARDENPSNATESDASEPMTDAAATDPKDGIANEGESCGQDGAHACTGHGTRGSLRCEGGTWLADAECAETERCDTAAGANRGTCKTIATECMNQQVNVPFCDAETMRVCTDLVSSQIRPCDEHRLCAPGTTGAVCKCEPGFVDDGTRCVAGTECGADQGGCDPLTKCSMSGGVRTCSACPSGYTGTGEAGCAPLLQGLTIDGAELEPPFDPAVRSYRAQLPVVIAEASITATAPGDTRVSFDSAVAPNGKAWTSPVLAVGKRSVELRLATLAGASTSYTITLERTGAQEHFIKASTPDREDWFGFTLAVSGGTFVTGAPYDDGSANGDSSNTVEDSGAAYVFARSGQGGWTQQQYVKASDAQANDNFGMSVAADGDSIVVGAIRSNVLATAPVLGSRSGVAYVFTRDKATWTQQKQLAASNARYGDQFGIASAMAGDTIAVGALFGGGTDGARGGAVYVYQRKGTDWTESQIVTPDAATAGFGVSIAIAGDRMIVGAPYEDGKTGSAYLFVQRDGRWTQEARLRPDSVEMGSKFGWSVALLGDRVAVGAPHHPDPPSSAPVPAGQVFVFERSAEGWQQTARVQAPIPDTSDQFGTSVTLSRSALAIGSNGEGSSATGTNGDAMNDDAAFAGAVYVYAKTNTTWQSTVYLKAQNTAAAATLGYVVAFAEDELVSGAPFESSTASGVDGSASNNTGALRSGAVYVFR